jgi:hypothetical protein
VSFCICTHTAPCARFHDTAAMFMSHAARNGHDPLGGMASPGNSNYAARALSPIPIGGREAIYSPACTCALTKAQCRRARRVHSFNSLRALALRLMLAEPGSSGSEPSKHLVLSWQSGPTERTGTTHKTAARRAWIPKAAIGP